MKKLLKIILLPILLITFINSAFSKPVQVVYHITDGIPQAIRALGNIRNHIAADPEVKIIVVAHGSGIDFLLEGAENAQGLKFSAPVAELTSQGVIFEVCKNTLDSRHIPENQVILEAKIVPSGVAEVAKLQAIDHFAYLKP